MNERQRLTQKSKWPRRKSRPQRKGSLRRGRARQSNAKNLRRRLQRSANPRNAKQKRRPTKHGKKERRSKKIAKEKRAKEIKAKEIKKKKESRVKENRKKEQKNKERSTKEKKKKERKAKQVAREKKQKESKAKKVAQEKKGKEKRSKKIAQEKKGKETRVKKSNQKKERNRKKIEKSKKAEKRAKKIVKEKKSKVDKAKRKAQEKKGKERRAKVPAAEKAVKISVSSEKTQKKTCAHSVKTDSGILQRALKWNVAIVKSCGKWKAHQKISCSAEERALKLEKAREKSSKKKAKKFGETFHFPKGKPCSKGKGSFKKFIKINTRSVVGTIPKGTTNVKLKLLSPKDVDVELWDQKTGMAVIAFGAVGKCNKLTSICDSANAKTVKYHGVKVQYSGYNGVKNANGARQYGHEFINLIGKTDRPYIMKVFGYNAGNALVKYGWGADKARCKKEKTKKEQKVKVAFNEKKNKHQAKVLRSQLQSKAAYKAAIASARQIAGSCKTAKAQVKVCGKRIKDAKKSVTSARTALKESAASCGIATKTAADCLKERRVKYKRTLRK